MPMHRTQILLEDRQYEALRAWARRTERSLSEAVRLAVDRLLGGRRRGARLSEIRGIFRDPGGPSGADHDRILYGGGR